MGRIEPIAESQADEKAGPLLAKIRTDWGRSWNVIGGIANNPAVLEGFIALNGAQAESGLSEAERELISIEMARANGCHYCVPAHILGARSGGLDEADIAAIVEGRAVTEPRLRVIQDLTHQLVETKGKLSDAAFEDFKARGVTAQQMIETIADIAHCTLTNYTNRLADTDFDDFLEDVSV